MSEKNEKIGVQFCSDLYDVLVYATMKILNDEENQFKEQYFDYSELFEHFEMVADKFIALKRLIDSYDKLSSELVGFAITNDVEDFDIEYTLGNDVLIPLKEKIDKQIKDNVEEWNDIADRTEKQEIRTRKELLLDFCDYLIETVPSIEYFEKQNANRLKLIENFLEDLKGDTDG